MKHLGLGIRHFFSATSFLAKHGLLYFYLFPILISVLFLAGMAVGIEYFSEYLVNLILGDYIPAEPVANNDFWSMVKGISKSTLSVALSVLIHIIVWLVIVKFSKYIVLILLSPVFAILSEKVEEKLTGNQYPFSWAQFLKDILRGSAIAIRNLFIELGLIAIFSLFGFMAGPFAFLIVPLLWLVSAYFYGFSMMDYTCERRKMSISQGVDYIRRNRGIAIGNGAMYMLLDLIPFVGLVFAPINAVVGATTAIIESEKNPDPFYQNK